MAPRKRTTNKGRKNDPKTAKLEAFLNDFDLEGTVTVSVDFQFRLNSVTLLVYDEG